MLRISIREIGSWCCIGILRRTLRPEFPIKRIRNGSEILIEIGQKLQPCGIIQAVSE